MLNTPHPLRTARLGDLLLHKGTITPQQLQHALGQQHQQGGRLGDILVNLKLLDRSQLRHLLRQQRLYRSAAVLITLMSVPQAALAATQGGVGLSSSGSLNISVEVAPQVTLSGLEDIQLNISDTSSDSAYSDGLCVQGSGASNYYVVAQGSGDNGQFALSDNQGNSLDYDVSYTTLDASQQESLLHGQRSSSYRLNRQCNDGDNSAITVNLPSQNLQQAQAGRYSGTLTLTISAE